MNYLKAKNKKLKTEEGLIIVYTGEGKGKTTAALGLAIRSAGWNKKVAIIQFIKGFKETGEWKFISNLKQIEIFQTLETNIPAISIPKEIHREGCKKATKLFQNLIRENQHDILILDEINNAMFYDLVEAGEIIEILKSRPAKQTVVLTGRNVPPEIVKIADLVTEMKEIKHPYKKGIQAKKGIDF